MEEQNTQRQLNNEERVRDSRHLTMPEVGIDGQRRLKAAHVLCIGAGGLGSPAALYLAAAGVGTIGIVDFDDVDLSNLQRQILHGTKDIGRSKLESARDRLRDANPNIEVELHECRFSSENASELVARYDLVVDGSDNFPTRYLSNDVCVFGRPVLPLPFSGAASARDNPELRGSRSSRCAAGDYRDGASDRGDKTYSRSWRAAHRTPSAFRSAQNEISGT